MGGWLRMRMWCGCGVGVDVDVDVDAQCSRDKMGWAGLGCVQSKSIFPPPPYSLPPELAGSLLTISHRKPDWARQETLAPP